MGQVQRKQRPGSLQVRTLQTGSLRGQEKSPGLPEVLSLPHRGGHCGLGFPRPGTQGWCQQEPRHTSLQAPASLLPTPSALGLSDLPGQWGAVRWGAENRLPDPNPNPHAT